MKGHSDNNMFIFLQDSIADDSLKKAKRTVKRNGVYLITPGPYMHNFIGYERMLIKSKKIQLWIDVGIFPSLKTNIPKIHEALLTGNAKFLRRSYHERFRYNERDWYFTLFGEVKMIYNLSSKLNFQTGVGLNYFHNQFYVAGGDIYDPKHDLVVYSASPLYLYFKLLSLRYHFKRTYIELSPYYLVWLKECSSNYDKVMDIVFLYNDHYHKYYQPNKIFLYTSIKFGFKF